MVTILLAANVCSTFAACPNGGSPTGARLLDVKPSANITGFTVIHGSAGSETAELELLAVWLDRTDTLYYFPETDNIMAGYFNRYIETGDEELLRELVYDYRFKVPQEASVETFCKWQRLRELSAGKTVRVVGTDIPGSYRFALRKLREIFPDSSDVGAKIDRFLADPRTNFAIGAESPVKALVDSLAALPRYGQSNPDTIEPNDVFTGIGDTYRVLAGEAMRDEINAGNYNALEERYGYRGKPQFIRMGVYHMMKEGFRDMYPGFMALLLGGGKYPAGEVYIVMGLLDESRVMGLRRYAPDGKFDGCGVQSDDRWTAGYLVGMLGFEGYRNGELTWIDLSSTQAGLGNMDGFPWKPAPGKVLRDYADAVVIIHGSGAARPIEEIM